MGTTWIDNRTAALSAGAVGIALVAASISAANHDSDGSSQLPTAEAAMVATTSGSGTQPEPSTTAAGSSAPVFGTSVIIDAGFPAPTSSPATTATSDVTTTSPGSTTAGDVSTFPPTSPAVEPSRPVNTRNPVT